MKNTERKVKFLAGNGSPIIAQKQGRNEKCACGSGKKSKYCCKIERYYNSKASEQPEKKKENE